MLLCSALARDLLCMCLSPVKVVDVRYDGHVCDVYKKPVIKWGYPDGLAPQGRRRTKPRVHRKNKYLYFDGISVE